MKLSLALIPMAAASLFSHSSGERGHVALTANGELPDEELLERRIVLAARSADVRTGADGPRIAFRAHADKR